MYAYKTLKTLCVCACVCMCRRQELHALKLLQREEQREFTQLEQKLQQQREMMFRHIEQEMSVSLNAYTPTILLRLSGSKSECNRTTFYSIHHSIHPSHYLTLYRVRSSTTMVNCSVWRNSMNSKAKRWRPSTQHVSEKKHDVSNPSKRKSSEALKWTLKRYGNNSPRT